MDRKKVQNTVDSIQYDWKIFDFDDFLTRIIQQHGRRIAIIETPNLAFGGYCVSVKQHVYDYIFVNADDHPISILHNKIHEIGHFLLNHLDSVDIIDSHDELRNLMMRFSRLRSYANMTPELRAEEREAEYFAYLVTQNVAKARRLHELTLEQESYDWGVPPFYGRFARTKFRRTQE